MITTTHPVESHGKLHLALLDAGLPIDGIRANGEMVFTRELTQDEQTRAEGIIATFVSGQTYDELRRAAYDAEIPYNEVIEALMEAHENPPRTERLEAVQAKRAEIKNRYPKG